MLTESCHAADLNVALRFDSAVAYVLVDSNTASSFNAVLILNVAFNVYESEEINIAAFVVYITVYYQLVSHAYCIAFEDYSSICQCVTFSVSVS